MTFRPVLSKLSSALCPTASAWCRVISGYAPATEKEFEDTLAIADRRVSELAELKVDLALLRVLCRYMLHGVEFDKESTRGLEKKHWITVMSTTMVQIQALKLFGGKRMVRANLFSR